MKNVKDFNSFLNEKNINTSPTGELIIVIAFILVSNFFLIKEVKKENTDLMKSIENKIEELNNIRERKEADRIKAEQQESKPEEL